MRADNNDYLAWASIERRNRLIRDEYLDAVDCVARVQMLFDKYQTPEWSAMLEQTRQWMAEAKQKLDEITGG